MSPETQQALSRFLAQAACARSVQIQEARILSGGAIQENWLIDARIEGGPHHGLLQAVLRCDSPSGVSVSHGRAQEFALLRVAFEAGVTVPEPLWLCLDRDVMGRPFFIMRRIAGTAAAHAMVKDLALGGNRQQLTERLGRELARIHSIRPPQAALEFLP
ncbi:MAG: hypothetical protein RL459_1569, partial [Pseudomonadota bacterium]